MLNMDPFTILATLVNLVILYLLMRKFLFKPVNDILDQRAKAIEKDLASARSEREEAQRMKENYEEHLKNTRAEAGEILQKAKNQGEEVYAKMVGDAKAEAQKLMEESARRNAHDREIMLKSVREEVASLVVEATAKMAESSESSIDSFLREEATK